MNLLKTTASRKTDLVYDASHVEKVFHVRAQDVHVLHDISLTIKNGEFIIMQGPSGCGKSTLLHILLGLEVPSAGKVEFLQNDLYEQADEDDRTQLRKKYVGMVYQQPNWIRALTVKENVMFALKLNGIDEQEASKKADEVLRMVKMSNWSEYFPSELSSGQQQKVSLARAIVTNPKVIIADEPTGNLDLDSGQELMRLMQVLNEQGKTIVMVTHDLEYVRYASRSIHMVDGRITKDIQNHA